MYFASVIMQFDIGPKDIQDKNVKNFSFTQLVPIALN